MMFYPDFISALDSTGKLSSALINRPETNNSRVSERGCNVPRPATFSGLTLPRISAGEPLRKEPQIEPSALRQTRDDDGWENRQPEDGATETDLTDGLEDKCPSNAVRNVEVSRPPGGALDIVTVNRSAADVSLKSCDHRRAGQELCYVCMQRAQRNVPLYQSDETRRAEREQERLLMLREHQKDLQYFQKQEVPKLTLISVGITLNYFTTVPNLTEDMTYERRKREDGQKVAAFNLGIAEAQRRRKEQTSSQSHGSYIFVGRPLTADRQPQWRCYVQELMQEAARRRQMQTHTQQEQRRLDKLCLLQLSEEIALKRSQQLHEKQEMATKYRKALEAQIDHRCSEISQRFDAQPVFGLMDCNPAALAEQRRRAQNISEELKNTANDRRREMLEKRLNEQKTEREIMQRDHKELLEERIRHYEKLRLLRAACEENWQLSADQKRQRDQEELNIRSFGGQTLTDQLEKYKRCSQCKRNTSNCGDTNIFRDTNYVAGARLML